MKISQKQQDRAPAGRDRFNAPARPPLKSQIVLSVKLFFIGGGVMLTLWLIDYAVTQ
jgi:hypothetical protein